MTNLLYLILWFLGCSLLFLLACIMEWLYLKLRRQRRKPMATHWSQADMKARADYLRQFPQDRL